MQILFLINSFSAPPFSLSVSIYGAPPMCQALSYGGNPEVHRTESCFPGTSLLVRQDT